MQQTHKVSRRGLSGAGITPAQIVYSLLLIVIGLFAGILIGYALHPVITAGIPEASHPETVVALAPTPTVAPTVVPTTAPTPSATMTLAPTASPSPTPMPTATAAAFEGPIDYGRSVQDRPLEYYRLGTGASVRILIGGIHGGYEWNTVEVVSETLKHYQANLSRIPAGVTLLIVPNANPDGFALERDTYAARVNANEVDLNRNWDYQHQITATHGTRPVSAGSFPFSEPETDSLRQLIEDKGVELAIFYHSAMGVVFSGAEPENSLTFELAEMLSRVSGYRHQTEGVPGQITTGDAIDWLSAKKGIAGAEIELTTHASVLGTEEFDRNLRTVQAFLEWPLAQSVQPAPVGDAGTGDLGVYTVVDGDTLSAIIYDRYGYIDGSSEYEKMLERIMQLNDIEDPSEVYAGQELSVPLADEGD